MSQKRAFLLFFLILSVQLVSLDPALPLPVTERGTLGEKIKRESIELKERVQETLFTATEHKTYDSLVLTGDVMLGRNVEVLMKQKGSAYPFETMSLTALSSNPAVVGNFEAAMASPHIMTESFQMKFSVDEVFMPAVFAAGFTHMSQANNHSFDYGTAGFLAAQTTLLRHDIKTFGQATTISHSSIAYVESEMGAVALIGINASSEIPQTEELAKVFDEAKSHSSLQIVYIHWGTEYEASHSLAQELLAKELVAAGADLIVGHHPHVVQDVSMIDGVVVFYSLGNYIFDQYFSSDVQQGLVLVLSLDDTPRLMLVPVSSELALSQPALMEPQQHSQFLDALAKRSDLRLQSGIRRGIIPLGLGVATSTKVAMMVR